MNYVDNFSCTRSGKGNNGLHLCEALSVFAFYLGMILPLSKGEENREEEGMIDTSIIPFDLRENLLFPVRTEEENITAVDKQPSVSVSDISRHYIYSCSHVRRICMLSHQGPKTTVLNKLGNKWSRMNVVIVSISLYLTI